MIFIYCLAVVGAGYLAVSLVFLSALFTYVSTDTKIQKQMAEKTPMQSRSFDVLHLDKCYQK